MKRIKTLLAMLLCMALLVGSLSACKKTDDTGKDSNSGKTNTEDTTDTGEPTGTEKELKEIDFSEHKEFTYWLFSSPNDYYSSYNDNPVVQYLNDKFNMTLSFEQPAVGTEQEAQNLMMGTGEYTDIIDVTSYSGSLSNLYKDGIIINIADYLDYMPNYKKLLEENEIFRKNSYNDDGQILKLSTLNTQEQPMWGGLVYRYDILDTMTGGNVQFPSGNEEPTTIEDFDYMLPLYKQYFEAAGMEEYAPLILPVGGIFPSNDLISSYGTSFTYFVDNGTVKYGPYEDGFYQYLKKMNEWYKAGYIYKDFASRTNDPFYLPNTSLTYGGAAGIWFGLTSQLGDVMSMPDYGLYFDVRGMKNPIDIESGITSAPNNLVTDRQSDLMGVVVTTACDEIERVLTVLDFMYSEEGSYLKGYGLDKEHGSAENEVYVKYGLEDGAFSFTEDGSITFNSQLDFMGGPLNNPADFRGNRLIGLSNTDYLDMMFSKEATEASKLWTAYQEDANRLPVGLIRTGEEDDIFTDNQSSIDDYVNSTILNFIIGSELNEATWEKFKSQLVAFGLEDNIAINQAAYDRYLAR